MAQSDRLRSRLNERLQFAFGVLANAAFFGGLVYLGVAYGWTTTLWPSMPWPIRVFTGLLLVGVIGQQVFKARGRRG